MKTIISGRRCGRKSKIWIAYRDNVIICDEDFDKAVIVGWCAKQEEAKKAKLAKYKELGRAVQNKSKRIPKRERNVNDSILALVSLGYGRTEAKLAVLTVREAHPRASVEKLVKGGLMRLKKGP